MCIKTTEFHSSQMSGTQWDLLNKEILRISGFPEMQSISVMLKNHAIRGILSVKNHLMCRYTQHATRL